MKNNDKKLRAPRIGCALLIAALAAGCSEQKTPEPLAVEDSTDALTQGDYDCERSKRECQVAADCDADKREACETAFRSCEEPLRAERERVHEMCRAEREKCEQAAAQDDENARHACHMQEHRCTLPVEPPDAICHVDAEECTWNANGMMMPEPGMPPHAMSDAEKACHETERSCRESKRLDPKDLPEAPHCEKGEPPPAPPECMPEAPTTGATDSPTSASTGMTQDHFACERSKRECLVAADCEAAKREACEASFRSCDEPFRAEHDRVHDMCRNARESCEDTATDAAARHACHMEEHRCNLPVEPPEAVCRIDAEECVWQANGMKMPEPGMPPHEMSEAEQACHDTEHACTESKRMHPEDLPEPPHCAPKAPHCMRAAPAAPAMPEMP